ncbi:MAG: hypothetical protein WA317_01470 [Mycobacterium sp.]|uniref:hypothetical protein n=1 Tax=Mycobacterium sp. TaxID=1785 RepID=UPI003CC66FDB
MTTAYNPAVDWRTEDRLVELLAAYDAVDAQVGAVLTDDARWAQPGALPAISAEVEDLKRKRDMFMRRIVQSARWLV